MQRRTRFRGRERNKNSGARRLSLWHVLSLLLLSFLIVNNVATAEASGRLYGTPGTTAETTTAASTTEAGLILEPNTTAAETTTSAEKETLDSARNDGSLSGRIYGENSSRGESTTNSVVIGYTSVVFASSMPNASTPAAQAYLLLRQEGFSAAAAAGVLGNIERESNFRPNAGSEDDVFGIFQVKGGGQTTMRNYCSSHGLDFYSLEGQLKSMINALAPTLFKNYTGKGCVYYWGTKTKVYGTDEHMYEPYYCWLSGAMTLDQFKHLDDPQYASEIWRRVVERNHGSASDIEKRRNFSQKYYDMYYAYDSSGSDIIAEAMKYVGNPYVWGGNSLTDGVDCSHFVWNILKITGHYSGGYMTSRGFRTAGETVQNLSYAMPGDVLCYDGHVAFYAGEGTIVHAAGRKRGIVMDTNVDIQKYHGGLLTIRRFR